MTGQVIALVSLTVASIIALAYRDLYLSLPFIAITLCYYITSALEPRVYQMVDERGQGEQSPGSGIKEYTPIGFQQLQNNEDESIEESEKGD
jgi:hypothetical protein